MKKNKYFIAKRINAKNEIFFHEKNTNLQKMQNITLNKINEYGLSFLNETPDVFFNIRYENEFNEDVTIYNKLSDLIANFLFNYTSEISQMEYYEDFIPLRKECLLLNFLVFKITPNGLFSLVSIDNIEKCIDEGKMDLAIDNNFDSYTDNSLIEEYVKVIEDFIIKGLAGEKNGTILINNIVETEVEYKNNKLSFKNNKFIKALNKKMLDVLYKGIGHFISLKIDVPKKDKTKRKFYKLYGFDCYVETDSSSDEQYPKLMLMVKPMTCEDLKTSHIVDTKDDTVCIYCDLEGNTDM